MNLKTLGMVGGLAVFAGAGLGVEAATIEIGTYQLHNHPDGNQSPPPYGLRLDGLLGNGSTSMTFDFDYAGAGVFMDYDGTSLHIYGMAFGGVDVGAGYSADPSLTSWINIDFTYSVTVGAPGDDDLIVVTPDFSNTGTVTWMDTGDVYDLFDYSGSHGYTFRLGDEDSDAGHRGFPGISGWGWLYHGPEGSHPDNLHYISSSDWLFTAKLIPLPSAVALGGLGIAGLGVRRRRSLA
ncbi:MAG: hypothetical protein ACF8GE_03490 [Phycisphaerales bacterium JB043]